MMLSLAADVARTLARHAEAVCRHYLPEGRRSGRYWLVGNVAGTPGRSLYVRLADATGDASGAGKWTDAQTGEHGDLLDLIAANRRLMLRDALDEARDFLRLPRPEPQLQLQSVRRSVQAGSPAAARRLWAAGTPLPGTLAEIYLRQREITGVMDDLPLRFHPRCYYRADDGGHQTWPALLAAVTDADGAITGVHRTWLDPAGGKAPVASPRRAMGSLLGNGVRFGRAADIVAIGEGIETTLSLRSALPALPTVAALSTAHLGAFDPPAGLRRIYIAADRDDAGNHAAARLNNRAEAMGIEASRLLPTRGDFNDDVRAFGAAAMRAALRSQLAPDDVDRLISCPAAVSR